MKSFVETYCVLTDWPSRVFVPVLAAVLLMASPGSAQIPNNDLGPADAECDCPTIPEAPGITTGQGDHSIFLTFLENYAPESFNAFGETGNTTASAYYRAVDPGNEKTNMKDWLVQVGFLDDPADYVNPGNGLDDMINTDSMAVYRNAADLGFGRRMFLRRNPGGRLASYVENYFTPEGARDRVGSTATPEEGAYIATVAFEWAPAADGSNPDDLFLHSYVFQDQLGGTVENARVEAANLDGNGALANPGVCFTCHGGAPQALEDNGDYPKNGDAGAYFLPWDIDTFEFLSDDPADPLSLEAQEAAFKDMSQAVLSTWPLGRKPDRASPGFERERAPVDLIEGWYGGPGMPNDTFDGTFVPDGWLPPIAPPEAAELYSEVIAPSCRACHMQRELALDFGSYPGFEVFRDGIEQLVFGVSGGLGDDVFGPPGDESVMPLAELTYCNFWSSDQPALLSDWLYPQLSTWDNAGGGSPGVNGTPQLVGSGAPTENYMFGLDLSDAAPNRFGFLWLSTAPIPINVAGGTLHAFPYTAQIPMFTDETGAFDTSVKWPVNTPGIEMWLQFVITDPAAPDQFTLSDAVMVSTM